MTISACCAAADVGASTRTASSSFPCMSDLLLIATRKRRAERVSPRAAAGMLHSGRTRGTGRCGRGRDRRPGRKARRRRAPASPLRRGLGLRDARVPGGGHVVRLPRPERPLDRPLAGGDRPPQPRDGASRTGPGHHRPRRARSGRPDALRPVPPRPRRGPGGPPIQGRIPGPHPDAGPATGRGPPPHDPGLGRHRRPRLRGHAGAPGGGARPAGPGGGAHAQGPGDGHHAAAGHAARRAGPDPQPGAGRGREEPAAARLRPLPGDGAGGRPGAPAARSRPRVRGEGGARVPRAACLLHAGVPAAHARDDRLPRPARRRGLVCVPGAAVHHHHAGAAARSTRWACGRWRASGA